MYAILDIEASGGNAQNAAIIELAIFRFNGTEIVDQFISLVHTEKEIHPYVQQLTGITNNMLHRSPKFHELAKRIIEITEDCILVGHGVNFDYQIIKKAFKQLGYTYEKVTLDTLTLSKELFPNEDSYSLGKLCHSIGIPLTDRHRAAGDARANVDLFQVLLNKDSNKKIIKKHCLETESEKKNRLFHLIDKLPNEIGIFHLLDKNRNIIFSSVSENISFGVKSFLLGKESSASIKLKEATYFIEYEKTHNEIIALLKYENQTTDLIKNKRKYFSQPSLYSFNVYKNKDLLTINENTKNKKPLIVFNEIAKAKEFVKELSKEESILKGLNKLFPHKNMLLIGKNSIKKEKFFILIKKNQLYGYGFYNLSTQINDPEKLKKITILASHNSYIFSIIRNYLYTSRFEKVIPHTF